jgi:hypothetical protein
MRFLIPYHYDLSAHSDACANHPEGDSLTVQSMTEDADINVMMRRMGVTGQMPDVEVRPVFFGDFEDVFDFRSAQQAIISARESFGALNADVRARFQNDPQLFMEFCSATDDGKSLKNIEEMRRLGLAIPVEPSSIAPVADAPPKKE